MTYGLYRGGELTDDFPMLKDFKTGELVANSGTNVDLLSVAVGDDIKEFIMSILYWIVMTIVIFVPLVVLLVVLEAVFWVSIFIILGMLYWFFRALKLVFSKLKEKKENLGISAMYTLVIQLYI